MIKPLKWRADSSPAEHPLSLERAYQLCDEITCDHSKTFYFSTRFLPAPKRRAIRAFYAFCRTTDDLVDVLAKSEPETRSRLLSWRTASRLSAAEQDNPVLAAWSAVREAYRVPQQYVEELIDGCEMDLSIRRYDTWEALRRYCYCVASTVGLISMHIIGLVDDSPETYARARAAAIDLGVAMQLTNILRDVGEDLRRGRIYLPQEDLQRFGYTEADLMQHVLDDRFRALMRFEIARARQLYAQSLPAVALLKPEGRLAVCAAGVLYRDILAKIEANDFDVFHRRAHLTFAEKLRRLPRILWAAKRLRC
ncbi:MAG: phytoene/squalene synthase family protein [Thermoflexales bacterium]|nr:phytoene/squalene synthase family protein [Thermoflexales bacterium]MCS7325494.1 phytoene/squalene synthase family protein [Thermoflexales bacterium]MDW8053928.1 phytoene/squalene synthase family protein [Anaerolineae bacterium]MDW8292470.1 phytoene/squalene synthase family protein [Anaerolineae bacterium]